MSIILILQLALNMIGVEPQALFSQEYEKGWYASPIVKVGEMADHSAIFVGAQGGWVLNHKLALGGKGYILTNPFEMNGMQHVNVGFGCCGFHAEYIVTSNELYHISIENMIGVGGLTNDVNNYYNDVTPVQNSSDMCFIMEPGVKMNLNVSRNFQLAAGVNYRLVGGVDFDGGAKNRDLLTADFRNLNSADIEGLSFQVELKMGRF